MSAEADYFIVVATTMVDYCWMRSLIADSDWHGFEETGLQSILLCKFSALSKLWYLLIDFFLLYSSNDLFLAAPQFHFALCIAHHPLQFPHRHVITTTNHNGIGEIGQNQ